MSISETIKLFRAIQYESSNSQLNHTHQTNIVEKDIEHDNASKAINSFLEPAVELSYTIIPIEEAMVSIQDSLQHSC